MKRTAIIITLAIGASYAIGTEAMGGGRQQTSGRVEAVGPVRNAGNGKAVVRTVPLAKRGNGEELPGSRSANRGSVEPDARLLDAIRQVESGGRSDAVGDGGRSRGAYQIGLAYWTDACQTLRVSWDYDRLVLSDYHCRAVMRAYWQRYGARTDEQKARAHNSGSGWRNKYKLTNGYWAKVKAELAKSGEAK